MIEAFPLYWPAGRPRTPGYKIERSKFVTNFTLALNMVQAELKRLGAREPIISTNMPLRKDGLPYASRNLIRDAGVAVYAMYKGKQICFACDRWDKLEDNLWAIAKTIDAMRGISRWGTGEMLDAAFTGFTALPPPSTSGSPRRSWQSILLNPASRMEAERQYKHLAREAHPDAGGSAEKMAELNDAISEARKALP